MIYFQQSCLEEGKQDIQKYQVSLQSLSKLEDTLECIKESREEFMVSLQEFIIIRLSCDDQELCEQVIQIIKNQCIKLVDKPLWNFKELVAELVLQLERHIGIG